MCCALTVITQAITLSDKPYVAAAMNVFAADKEADARHMMTSMQQQFVSLRRGMPGPLKAPVDDINQVASPHELQLPTMP